MIAGQDKESIQDWVTKETLLNQLKGYDDFKDFNGADLAEVFGDGDEYAGLLASGTFNGSLTAIRIKTASAANSK